MASLDSAAAKLAGVALGNGWKVDRLIVRSEAATGGHFSHSYTAIRCGERGEVVQHGFLKAFDFSDAFHPDADMLLVLKTLTNWYEHERDLLLHCKGRKFSKVVLPVWDGRYDVPGLPLGHGTVFYIIFELADGDIRNQVHVAKRLNTLWSLRALRDVCLGVNQIHRDLIAHQDIKPSNVLAYDSTGGFKIADLGRASKRGNAAPHDEMLFPGDRTYQPPEFMYSYADPDFVRRRIGADLFMVGNIACFLFAGVNIMTLLCSRLASAHAPENWRGTYDQVLPYLESAFTESIEEVRPYIEPAVADNIITMVKQLCAPNIQKRGHARSIGSQNQYSLERYVSELDLLVKRREIAERVSRVA